MGKTCEPKAFSFQCMTKFTTNKKKNDKKKANAIKKNIVTSSIQTLNMVLIKKKK